MLLGFTFLFYFTGADGSSWSKIPDFVGNVSNLWLQKAESWSCQWYSCQFWTFVP